MTDQLNNLKGAAGRRSRCEECEADTSTKLAQRKLLRLNACAVGDQNATSTCGLIKAYGGGYS